MEIHGNSLEIHGMREAFGGPHRWVGDPHRIRTIEHESQGPHQDGFTEPGHARALQDTHVDEAAANGRAPAAVPAVRLLLFQIHSGAAATAG